MDCHAEGRASGTCAVRSDADSCEAGAGQSFQAGKVVTGFQGDVGPQTLSRQPRRTIDRFDEAHSGQALNCGRWEFAVFIATEDSDDR
jgi:hypothetical protein